MKVVRVAFIIAAMVMALSAQATFATHWASAEVVPATDSQDCAGGTKINDPESGVAYAVSFDGFAGTITFTITNSPAGPLLAFQTDSPDHLVTSMLVKGGPTSAILYTYAGDGVDSDTGLHAPVNPNNGKYYGVSHICSYLAKK